MGSNQKSEIPTYKALATDLSKQAIDSLNKGDSTTIFGKIVSDLEDVEVDRRIGLVKKELKGYKELKEEVDTKLRADLKGERNAQGVEVVPARYSSERWDKREQAIKKMDAIVDALTTADKKNDFTALDKLYPLKMTSKNNIIVSLNTRLNAQVNCKANTNYIFVQAVKQLLLEDERNFDIDVHNALFNKQGTTTGCGCAYCIALYNYRNSKLTLHRNKRTFDRYFDSHSEKDKKYYENLIITLIDETVVKRTLKNKYKKELNL